LTASTGSLVNPFQYTARESDTETGLYYYRARYYDQTVGRFISEDPRGFDGGANFYIYAANSPLKYVDPFGTCIIEMWVVHTGEHNEGTLYHSFLTFYNNSGGGAPAPTMILRGEPSMGNPPSLEATKFPLNIRSIDQPGDSIYMKTLLINDCSCGPYVAKMDNLIKKLEDKRVPYGPFSSSNSVTYTAIKDLGLTPPNLPLSVLKFLWGWGWSVP
jgi:RHS repeat-associated protein